MNARRQTFELTLEGRQVPEAVSSLFSTVLLHRTLGRFHYKKEDSYSIGTIGYEDVDCDFIDFTYVRCSSPELNDVVQRHVTSFTDTLQNLDGQRMGHISLTFFQTRKARWPFPRESTPWEVWTVQVEAVSLQTEHERQVLREKLVDELTEKVFLVAAAMNRPDFVPKMPSQSELDYVFDTSFSDVQPYLFEISHETVGSKNVSVSSTVRKLLKDTLSI
ncbi:autophagy-related protein 101-like [Artemia franciscana]|uniref:Autophagy-related protein 101 n=1 Tax=Artemia franciscana TaxID=6661 RepID=A0AA88I292_ARTSF|nr:hypothetical protein QYM36_003745 [Artemia franciscana]